MKTNELSIYFYVYFMFTLLQLTVTMLTILYSFLGEHFRDFYLIVRLQIQWDKLCHHHLKLYCKLSCQVYSVSVACLPRSATFLRTKKQSMPGTSSQFVRGTFFCFTTGTQTVTEACEGPFDSRAKAWYFFTAGYVLQNSILFSLYSPLFYFDDSVCLQNFFGAE